MDLVAYIRVSKVGGREGDSFQSPAEQRRAIEAIVRLTPGARIVAEFEDLNESGGTMDRPEVKKAIAMVESGQADGIVCAYLDRWARTVEALEMIESWAKRGKTFISAADKFDATTSQGKFALGMMLLVAKYYRDVISDRWDASCRNAIGRGVHVSVPYGYRRENGKGSKLVIFEPEAIVVRRIFAERIADTGIAEIAHGLNADGVASSRGGQWTRQAVRALLRVRSYTGEASRGEYVLDGAHDAIVTRGQWDAAQTERAPAKQNGKSLLVGLVRCKGCGYVMGAGSSTHGGRRYNCNRHHAELRCPSPTTAPADKLEQLVEGAFLNHYGHVKVQGARRSNPAVAETEKAMEQASAVYARWRDNGELQAEIGDEEHTAGLIARKRDWEEKRRAHADAVRKAGANDLSIDPSVYPTLSLRERRELMKAGIDAVVLHRASSTHTPLVDRLEVLFTNELDHDGSRGGIAAAVRERP
jgi:DNA invertase Pin-like site-specific DNA recombinase